MEDAVASWARRLSAARSHSSVSRWATKTSVFSPAARQPGACAASHARRGSARVGLAGEGARAPRRRGPGAPGATRPRRARGARARPSGGARGRAAPERRARRPRARGGSSRPRASPSIGDAHARRQAADVHAPRRAGAGGSGSGRASRASKLSPSGKSAGRSSCSRRKKPCTSSSSGIARQQQHVPAEGGDRRDRAPGRVAGMAGRPPQAVRLVDHQQVDAGLDRACRELGPRDERLERDHGAAVHVERVEVGAEVARHVGEARVVEQHEDLVVLAPQLAEPLHGQRLGGDHQAALGAPACGRGGSAPGRPRSSCRGPPRRRAASAPGRWRSPARRRGAGAGRAGSARRGTSRGRSPRGARRGAARRAGAPGPRPGRGRAAASRPTRSARASIGPAVVGRERVKRRGAPREPQRHAAVELHHDRAAVHRDDASRPELGVVLVPQPVAHAPRVHARIVGARRSSFR